jgi:threonyl-tRNA synthetase
LHIINFAYHKKAFYFLLFNDKEEKTEGVSVKEFKTKEQYAMGVSEFLEKIEVMRREKHL